MLFSVISLWVRDVEVEEETTTAVIWRVLGYLHQVLGRTGNGQEQQADNNYTNLVVFLICVFIVSYHYLDYRNMGLHCSKMPSNDNGIVSAGVATRGAMGPQGGNDSWNSDSDANNTNSNNALVPIGGGGFESHNAQQSTQQQQQAQRQQQEQQQQYGGPMTRQRAKMANNSHANDTGGDSTNNVPQGTTPRRSIFRVGSIFMSNRSLKRAAAASLSNRDRSTQGDVDADSMDRSSSATNSTFEGKPSSHVKNKKDVFDFAPGSPRARADTYSHVHAAVMYNFNAAERSKHDQSVPMGVIGLKNLGNTCFLNSSLQCLSATIPLTDYFLGYDYRKEINKDNFLGTGGKLVVAYAELMKQMWLEMHSKKSIVEPNSFKKHISTFAPQFSGYHQHDSQELLAFLLDGIHEDLNRVKTRPYVEDRDCDGTNDEKDAIEAWKNYLRRNKSLVVDLFQGQLRNTCTCLTCGHVNIRFEPFMYLSLPIPSKKSGRAPLSLMDCLDLYLDEETLKGADQWYCEKCKKHVDATKKTDLWILPPILIVHLKRFRYNDYGKVGSKNDAPIKYPVSQWDLSDSVRSKGGLDPIYDLYAVSNHMGSLGGGHYTALAMNRFDDVWYEFNDSRYRPVEPTIHKNHMKSAYVLFYNRSEGDLRGKPLNERMPMIRRQSVSRPDMWPHNQVENRETVRDFTRSSRRLNSGELIVPSLLATGDFPSGTVRKSSVDSSSGGSSTGGSKRTKRSTGKKPSVDAKTSGVAKLPPLAASRGTRSRPRSGSTGSDTKPTGLGRQQQEESQSSMPKKSRDGASKNSIKISEYCGTAGSSKRQASKDSSPSTSPKLARTRSNTPPSGIDSGTTQRTSAKSSTAPSDTKRKPATRLRKNNPSKRPPAPS